jgi:enoyl-CoA hydratase/carnithine racemase
MGRTMGAVNQQLVLREDRGAVRVLTMNRPESRNALNTELISALSNPVFPQNQSKGEG